jgi:hypothetical protein
MKTTAQSGKGLRVVLGGRCGDDHGFQPGSIEQIVEIARDHT